MHTRRAPPSSCLRAYSALACARHSDHPGRRSTSATSGLELHSAAPCSNEPAATCGVRTLSAIVPGGDCATRLTPMSTRESAAAPKIAAPAAPTARSIQLQTVPKFLEVQPRREAANRAFAATRYLTRVLYTRHPRGTLCYSRKDESIVRLVAKHAILLKYAARVLDSRWHRPGVHSAC